MLALDPHDPSLAAQAQEILGSKSPWADLSKLIELQSKCKGVPGDMLWCLQGVNRLLHRKLLPSHKLSYRDLAGNKYKRSFLLVLLFKHKLKNYLSDTFATQALGLGAQDVTALREALSGFASFDQMTDSQKERLEFVSEPARGLARFIGSCIYGVDADQSLANGTLALPSVEDWVHACPGLQCLVASLAPRRGRGATRQGGDAGEVPHICSVALPWLTAEKEHDLPPDVMQIINSHKDRVHGIMQDHVRVLDGKVADDTCRSQLSQFRL